MKDRDKQGGAICKPGIGMTGGYDAADTPSKAKAKKKWPVDKSKCCSGCGELGHLHPTNELCSKCVPRKKKAKNNKEDNATLVDLKDVSKDFADEMEKLDCLPLHDESSTDAAFYSAASEYEDTVIDDADDDADGTNSQCII